MKTLIYNAIHCNLCDDTIQSYHKHDYKHCSCRNAMVDGGLSYEKFGASKDPNTIISFSLYLEDHPFSVIRQYYYKWNPLTDEYVLLKDIDNDWLDAILNYYICDNKGAMDYKYLLLFLMEKQYRNEGEE